jgi:hypothetical protein
MEAEKNNLDVLKEQIINKIRQRLGDKMSNIPDETIYSIFLSIPENTKNLILEWYFSGKTQEQIGIDNGRSKGAVSAEVTDTERRIWLLTLPAWAEIEISKLWLSTRVHNVLVEAEIKTIEDLVSYAKAGFDNRKIKNLRTEGFNEIILKLTERGLITGES